MVLVTFDIDEARQIARDAERRWRDIDDERRLLLPADYRHGELLGEQQRLESIMGKVRNAL